MKKLSCTHKDLWIESRIRLNVTKRYICISQVKEPLWWYSRQHVRCKVFPDSHDTLQGMCLIFIQGKRTAKSEVWIWCVSYLLILLMIIFITMSHKKLLLDICLFHMSYAIICMHEKIKVCIYLRGLISYLPPRPAWHVC